MSNERSDIEKLREWLDKIIQYVNEAFQPPCETDEVNIRYGQLTEARELAKRIEEKLGAWENGPDWMKAFFEEKAKLSTAEAERDDAKNKLVFAQHDRNLAQQTEGKARDELAGVKAERDVAREEMKLLRNVSTELWGQRDMWDESPTRFLAWTHNQTGEEVVRGMKAEAEVISLRARVEKLEAQQPPPRKRCKMGLPGERCVLVEGHERDCLFGPEPPAETGEIERLKEVCIEAETVEEAIQIVESLKKQNLEFNDVCVAHEKKITCLRKDSERLHKLLDIAAPWTCGADCGKWIVVDEDGCCVTCGAVATRGEELEESCICRTQSPKVLYGAKGKCSRCGRVWDVKPPAEGES